LLDNHTDGTTILSVLGTGGSVHAAGDAIEPLLRVERLTKRYRTRAGEVVALAEASFAVGTGEIVGLLGPNGAGKTTAIKCVCGLVTPTEGAISIGGIDAVARRKSVARLLAAVLEGNRTVYWRLSVRENLEYFASLRGLRRRAVEGRVSELIERFGLTAKSSTPAMRLSRGMQQKLALACAVLPASPLLVLDEPTLGLDVETSHELRGYLRDLAGEGHTILLSSHDMDVVRDVCERAIVVNHGRVIADDRIANLLGVFDARRYRIRLGERLRDPALDRLRRRFDVTEEPTAGLDLDIALAANTDIYGLMTALQQLGAVIEAVNTTDTDLEAVFLNLVRAQS
jgi:ABC-2 type transport system ATP-binding protein